MLLALCEMQIDKVSIELIAANRGVEIQVMAEVCHRVLDGFGMPNVL